MNGLVLKDGKCFLALQCAGYITISLKGDCDAEYIEDFNRYLKTGIEYSNQHMLINCEMLDSITVEWIKPLLFLQMQLSLHNKKVCFVSINDCVLKFFKTLGAEKAFVMTEVREALIEFGINRQQAS